MPRAKEDDDKVKELRERMAELGIQLCDDAATRNVSDLKETYEAIASIYNAIKGQ